MFRLNPQGSCKLGVGDRWVLGKTPVHAKSEERTGHSIVCALDKENIGCEF